jgi:lipopolysaccharide biosynthesis glycosyltransferase
MLRVFIGFDERVAVQYHVLAHSLLEHSSIPLQVIPLSSDFYPLERDGLTKFTWARFLVPYLCGFEGPALFLDSDILCTGDIAEILSEPMGDHHAVGVCNTNPAYERAAVMLFNCGHPDNAKLTPEFIERTDEKLHLTQWTKTGVCWLKNRFNFLVSYDDPAWCKGQIPTLIHYTQGVPAWPETANCDYADLWIKARERAFKPAVNWSTLLGKSNHAAVGPGGIAPAPRVPDAIRQPQRTPHESSESPDASRGFRTHVVGTR